MLGEIVPGYIGSRGGAIALIYYRSPAPHRPSTHSALGMFVCVRSWLSTSSDSGEYHCRSSSCRYIYICISIRDALQPRGEGWSSLWMYTRAGLASCYALVCTGLNASFARLRAHAYIYIFT